MMRAQLEGEDQLRGEMEAREINCHLNNNFRSCESGMSASVLEAMLNNIDPSPAVVVEPTNYKRPLSPIMEESEEENTTIKTSILIDTKNLDSMR